MSVLSSTSATCADPENLCPSCQDRYDREHATCELCETTVALEDLCTHSEVAPFDLKIPVPHAHGNAAVCESCCTSSAAAAAASQAVQAAVKQPRRAA